MADINKTTYWECKICKCTWSGGIDFKEMFTHYCEDHPKADYKHLIEKTDFMTRKTVTWLSTKK